MFCLFVNVCVIYVLHGWYAFDLKGILVSNLYATQTSLLQTPTGPPYTVCK